ncbi:MAG: leucyl aminopeptidase family protein [Phycisphaeraceae bacterium]|nr:leucyl aminopeptidase family protein [Phycisphaeraceae bacterium]MCW5762149.1 leucyl aminopeptidase family protein [Phycisphaeraceae bacterium]
MFESVRVGSRGNVDTLVLGCFSGEKLDRASARRDTDGAARAAMERGGFAGEIGSIVEGNPREGVSRVLVIGLGAKDRFGAEALRTVSASIARRLASVKAANVEIDFGASIKSARMKAADAGAIVGETVGIAGWVCDEFRGSASSASKREKLSLRSDDAEFVRGLKRGLGIAEGVNIARTLSQTPPNIATPMEIARRAKAMGRKLGLKVSVMSGAKLREERMTGLITVGQASENEPCLIRMEYQPARAKKGMKPAVLVGKTITYDTGGLSLKINNGMKGMKRDKDGGCAVFGAMHAIATVIKPNRPVVGILVAAENSISDEAYRPDDIITYRNGVTVEVTNTDAEGRLVLADGLCWAMEKEKPAYVVDIATLTGGVVVALGKAFAGYWCEDEALRARVEAAGAASGDRVWRLPHDEAYQKMMKSPVADIVNSAPVREAHPIQGAAFLRYFVDYPQKNGEKAFAWAHVDIAGTHVVESDTGPFVAGPTGFGVRLLASLLEGDDGV